MSDDSLKRRQLNRHKALATGLFFVMMVIYALTTWLMRAHPAPWQGYVNAFSEAGMVGALADWFAVTALFHYPLGLRIPHTNIIENSKQRIGSNLGNFVVENFLNGATIRPYLEKMKLSPYAAGWLSKQKNKDLLLREVTAMVQDALSKLDDQTAAGFLAKKAGDILDTLDLNALAARTLRYFVDKREHQQLITLIALKVGQFIAENEEMVRQRVKKESYFFIPSFVDNKLADKIANGLMGYFEEIAEDPEHRIREEITTQLYEVAHQLETSEKWKNTFAKLKGDLLASDRLEGYALTAWQSFKEKLGEELAQPEGPLHRYLSKTMDEMAYKLETDDVLQEKIDSWLRVQAYQLVLRHGPKAGALIENTVGGWEGKDLSDKLELEVGKDLQFIRINGTLVGGLVGLVIYVVTELLS